jgi:hypothetical protein
MTFTPSKALVVMARLGYYRMTRDASLPDFSLWRDNRIIAQGGFPLINSLFDQIESEFADVRDDMPVICHCRGSGDFCICSGAGTP